MLCVVLDPPRDVKEANLSESCGGCEGVGDNGLREAGGLSWRRVWADSVVLVQYLWGGCGGGRARFVSGE